MLASRVAAPSGAAWCSTQCAPHHRCRRHHAATGGSTPHEAAQGPPEPAPAQQQQRREQREQRREEFDIVSGTRLPQAEGPSCDWPRPDQRRRWEEAALMTTGFPVPAGYGTANLPPAAGSGMLWRLRNPERDPPAATSPRAPAAGAAARRRPGPQPGTRSATDGASGAPGPATPVVPVFRAAPYSAEAARQRRPSPTARILFLDDGCTCRAPLAVAVLQGMLSKLAQPLDVEAHAASIGPPVPGGHDDRVAQVAREMDVPLPARRPPPREFDEMRDTVDYDLILVMDRYDRQEVVREVSVLERLNPGGAYLTRVHRLSEFAHAVQLVLKDRCLLVPEDVPDPFYGVVSAAAEQASLRRTVHSLALCCRGLLTYLLKLRSRCGSGGAAVPLRLALAQSLQCPLMDPTSHHALSALIHCQLAPAQLALWQQQGQGGQDSEGSAAATRRGRGGLAAGVGGTPTPHAVDWAAHVSGWPRPVWVEEGPEDGEDDGSGSDDQRPLWTVREVAGQAVVVRRPRRQQPASRRGYWSSFENVQQELSKWMEGQGLRGRLPSQQELRGSGANTLSARVDSHGGLSVFAERMGLPLASGRAANGHWSDFGHLAEELRWYVQQAEQQQAEQRQRREEEGEAAAAGPEAAAAAGPEQEAGWEAAAEGGDGGAPDAGDGASPRTMRFASRSWSSGGGGLEPGPASAVLLGDGGSHEGGAGAGGSPGGGSSGLVFMPTQQELRLAGRADLVGAIRQHGGSLAVARRLGWAVRHGRLPSEAAVLAQLMDFAEQRQQRQQQRRRRARRGRGGGAAGGGAPPAPAALEMPTLRELEEGGRADLAGAVVRLGGVQVFAYLMQAEQQRRQQRQRRPRQEPQQEQAQLGPRSQQAPARHRPHASHILSYALGSSSGGGGRRLPPPVPPQPAVVRVGQAVVQLIEARGWERRVPTKQELVAAGRRDLHAAITRCGGAQKLAEHLQLPYAETRGRRKRSQLEQQQGQQGEVELGLQPGFLAARLRAPPGGLYDPQQQPAGGDGGAPGAAAQPRRGVPAAQRPQGPASRLLERELVLEAYTDTTFV